MIDRFRKAEAIRLQAYAVIDCFPSTARRSLQEDIEFTLWDIIHKNLVELAAFYEKMGFRPWKH